MDSTPSNGSGVRARSRKANTSPVQAPNGASAKTKSGRTNGASSAKAPTRQRAKAPRRQLVLPPFDTYSAIAIEDIQPELDGGQWPIKRVVGDRIEVSADIFKEGHDQ